MVQYPSVLPKWGGGVDILLETEKGCCSDHYKQRHLVYILA